MKTTKMKAVCNHAKPGKIWFRTSSGELATAKILREEDGVLTLKRGHGAPFTRRRDQMVAVPA
jgi:hypothetical protein